MLFACLLHFLIAISWPLTVWPNIHGSPSSGQGHGGTFARLLSTYKWALMAKKRVEIESIMTKFSLLNSIVFQKPKISISSTGCFQWLVKYSEPKCFYIIH